MTFLDLFAGIGQIGNGVTVPVIQEIGERMK